MRTNLRNGVLIPPASLEAALHRRQQLAHEIKKVETQLKDPERGRTMAEKDHLAWHDQASRALQFMKEELRQLCRWIDRERGAMGLLRRAWELLVTLRNEGVEFEDDEIKLIDELTQHFEARDRRATGSRNATTS